jgi:hypothetical protein
VLSNSTIQKRCQNGTNSEASNFKKTPVQRRKLLRDLNPEIASSLNSAAGLNQTGFIAPLTEAPCLRRPPK